MSRTSRTRNLLFEQQALHCQLKETDTGTTQPSGMKRALKNVLILIAGLCCLASQSLLFAQSSSLFGGDASSSMQVDILPDSEDNAITRNSGRSLPVAILGTASFDVNSINPRTITFRGVDVMLVGKTDKSWCKIVDLNDDGFPDLLCEVRTTGFRVDAATYTIELQAETYDKTRLRGQDKLKIIEN